MKWRGRKVARKNAEYRKPFSPLKQKCDKLLSSYEDTCEYSDTQKDQETECSGWWSNSSEDGRSNTQEGGSDGAIVLMKIEAAL